MSVFKIKKGYAEIRMKDRDHLLHTGCVLDQDDMTDETVFSSAVKEDAVEEFERYETSVAYMPKEGGLSYYLVTEYWLVEEDADGEFNICAVTPFPLIWPGGSTVDEEEYAAIVNIMMTLNELDEELLDMKGIQQEIFNNRITRESGVDHKDYIWYDHDYEDISILSRIGEMFIITDAEKVSEVLEG